MQQNSNFSKPGNEELINIPATLQDVHKLFLRLHLSADWCTEWQKGLAGANLWMWGRAMCIDDLLCLASGYLVIREMQDASFPQVITAASARRILSTFCTVSTWRINEDCWFRGGCVKEDARWHHMAMAYMLVKMCMRGTLLPNVLNNCLRDMGNSHLRKKNMEVSARGGRGKVAHMHTLTS